VFGFSSAIETSLWLRVALPISRELAVQAGYVVCIACLVLDSRLLCN
jgi:hypothetical protein